MHRTCRLSLTWLVLLLAAALLLKAGCSPGQIGVDQPEIISPTLAVPVLAPDSPPAPAPLRWLPGQLQLHVLDVKHGDAQLIISPTGETLLIDVGRVEHAGRVAQYLRGVLGQAAVDYLMLSHYHVDHIQGLVPLLRDEGLQVRSAILDRGGGRDEYDSPFYREYYDYVSDPAHGLRRVRVHVGDQVDLGPRITVSVLAVGDIDTHLSAGLPTKNDNDNSIALWLTFGKFDYWTAGDLSGQTDARYTDIETAVIPFLPRAADVYRANHHGIDYNSNPRFLAALDPTVILISTSHEVVGWKTVLRLEKQGDVYITDEIPAHKPMGDITVVSQDGDSFVVAGRSYDSK